MTTTPSTPARSDERPFLDGFGLGLVVPPLALLFSSVIGGSAVAGWMTFGLCTVGALSLRPVTTARVFGFLTGLVTFAVAGFALLVAVLSQVDL